MPEFPYNSGIGHDTSIQEIEAGSLSLTSQQPPCALCIYTK